MTASTLVRFYGNESRSTSNYRENSVGNTPTQDVATTFVLQSTFGYMFLLEQVPGFTGTNNGIWFCKNWLMVQYELIKHNNNITWWRGSPSANPSFGDDLTKTQKKKL